MLDSQFYNFLFNGCKFKEKQLQTPPFLMFLWNISIKIL